MVPREGDKAMDGLLRRTLARSRDRALVCPEPEILAAYFERSLGAGEIDGYELHFSQCTRCREQLAAMARAGAPVGASADGSEGSSRWAWLWDWRWLAVPAAAALAFAIFGLLWMRPPKNMALQAPAPPPVALSQPAAPPPPPGRQALTQLDQKSEEPRATPTQKQIGPPARDVTSSAARVATRNAPAMAVSSAAPHNAASAANARGQTNAGAGGALPRADQAQQSGAPAGAVVAPGSVSEMVRVEPSAPPVAAPSAMSPASAGKAGASASGVTADTINAPLATTGANAQALDEIAPAKKREKQSRAAAMKSEVGNTNQDASRFVTAEDKSLQTMILTPDPAILWRFAGSGFVERSTDGGATWQGEEPVLGGQLVAGAAPSASVCWLVGRSGLILVTKDAKSWKKVAPPVDGDFVAVSAESAPNATVTAADGRKFTTRNGGKKWKPAE